MLEVGPMHMPLGDVSGLRPTDGRGLAPKPAGDNGFLEALQAATIVSAEAYKLDNITGAIEPNLEADLIAFDRNPLEDILIITEPVLVISNGRIALNRQLIPTKPGRVPGN